MNRSPSLVSRALTAFGIGLTLAAGRVSAAPLSFAVSFAPSVRSTPFTGRILVFTGAVGGSEPRFGPDLIQPRPLYALDVHQLSPGATVVLDEHALGFPAPPTKWPSRPTRFQAVLDQAPDDSQIGTAPGNGVSAPVLGEPTGSPVQLVIDRLIPFPKFAESPRVKLVDIPSPLLTRFYQRPMRLRAGVVLPDGYSQEPDKRFPVLYYIPGFGGNHFQAFDIPSSWPSLGSKNGPNALVVVLDPTAHTGHHVFADSANNGPVGAALVKEMLPFIDRTFRTVARPAARLLTGHSSGGWSSLWLQVTYPDLFGGVWSNSPDPVDFHDLQQIDLYAPGANLFTDSHGSPRPLARGREKPVGSLQTLSDVEAWDMAANSSRSKPSSAPAAAMAARCRSTTVAAERSIPPLLMHGRATTSAGSCGATGTCCDPSWRESFMFIRAARIAGTSTGPCAS